MVRILLYLFLFTIIVASCKVTEYPASGNYALETKINILGDYPQKEKDFLAEKLRIQIDDSLQYNKVSKKTSGILGFIKHPVKIYHNFDSSNISRTMDFFKAAYVANGYFRGGETKYRLDTIAKTNNLAIVVTFDVEPFKNHYMDSISYSIYDSGINTIVAKNWKETLLKKKDLYAQDVLQQEIQRITYDLHNEGYLFFSQSDLKVVADTINTALLKPFDPFEEQSQLLEAAEFDKNPNTDITITLRDNINAKKLKKYYIGKLFIHSDNYDKDFTPPNNKILQNGQVIKYYTEDKYKDELLINHIFLKHGQLYAEKNAVKTTQVINNLNVWQQVTIEPLEKSIRNDTVDFAIFMQAFQQFESETKLEGNYNQASGTSTALYSGPKNLFGFNFFFNLKNRNFNKQGVLASLSTNASTDFGKPQGATSGQTIFNTVQVGLTGSLLYPELKLFKKLNDKEKIKFPKAGFNANISYSERLNFFKLFEYSTGYGSKFGIVTKNNYWDAQFNINFENKLLEKRANLITQIAANPSLNNIYRDGIIAGASASFQKVKTIPQIKNKQTNLTTSKRVFAEFSGLPGLKTDRLFSFVKFEWDQRFYFQNKKKNTWAFRAFAGIGHAFNQSQSQNKFLPFFRQFVGGGPSSLRAWTVRDINSYSTRNKDTSESFGDIQIEINAEYRHKLFSLIGIPVQGGAFIDMGNIWNWTPTDPTVYPLGKSLPQRIGDDIAMALGYGLRIDFNYFLIRFDLATKLKQPKTITGDGGFLQPENYDQLNDIKFQLGINMPF